jgi:hypothetical protein
MEFTEKELAFLDFCLTAMRIREEESARAYRMDPVCEGIAESCDALAAQAAALLVRIRAEGRS